MNGQGLFFFFVARPEYHSQKYKELTHGILTQHETCAEQRKQPSG